MGVYTQYRIDYRPQADIDAQHSFVSAFRVEGWRADYAFFANPRDLSEATLLIPRELVQAVSRMFDKEEFDPEAEVQPHQN